jgi:hypothetical protein
MKFKEELAWFVLSEDPTERRRLLSKLGLRIFLMNIHRVGRDQWVVAVMGLPASTHLVA